MTQPNEDENTKYIAILTNNRSIIKEIKLSLETANVFNKDMKIVKLEEDDIFSIPTTIPKDDNECEIIDKILAKFNKPGEGFHLEVGHYLWQVRKKNKTTLYERIIDLVKQTYGRINDDDDENLQQLINHVPKKWNVYPPMVLFPQHTFDDTIWVAIFEADMILKDVFLSKLCDIFNHDHDNVTDKITHLAINKPIIETDNCKRIPYNLTPLYGDFGPGPNSNAAEQNEGSHDRFEKEFWCHCVQADVLQNWAPRYTMFSRGNIVEKLRILNNFEDVKDKVIVDLYSGIGYFTLYYLKLNPKMMFCWELNPWSNQGLIKSLKKMNITYKLIHANESLDELDPNIKVYIFQEDNENCINRLENLKSSNAALSFQISHINLGLLPTSTKIWAKMLQICELSCNDKTIAHIHENCHVNQLETVLEKDYLKKLKGLNLNENMKINPISLNKIKTYAPDVWHIVCDYEIRC